MDVLAKRIRNARLRAGLTVDELAVRCGVTPAAVEGWESGVRPQRGDLAKLAVFLGLDLDLTDSVVADDAAPDLRAGIREAAHGASGDAEPPTHRPDPRDRAIPRRRLVAALGGAASVPAREDGTSRKRFGGPTVTIAAAALATFAYIAEIDLIDTGRFGWSGWSEPSAWAGGGSVVLWSFVSGLASRRFFVSLTFAVPLVYVALVVLHVLPPPHRNALAITTALLWASFGAGVRAFGRRS